MKQSLDAFLSDAEERLGADYPDCLTAGEYEQALNQDVAGLVAVVRAVPTREQVAKAIHDSIQREAPDEYVGPCYDNADAVLALFKEVRESAVPGSESQNNDEARSLLSEETPSETVREPRSLTSKAAAGLDGGTP